MPQAITANRSTEVVFDTPGTVLLEPWFAYERRADSFGRNKNEQKTDVVLLPRSGWILRPYVFDPGAVHETDAGGAGVQSLGAGLLTLAGTFVEKPFFRDPGLTGVTYSGSPASGSLMWQKRIGAGDTFADSLSADQAAYPSPQSSTDTVSMDRVAKTTSNFEPDDTVLFRLYVPGSAITVAGAVATLYFTGLAGSNDVFTGLGQYALKLMGDGFAVLFERDKAEDLSEAMWKVRHTFRWAHPQLVYGVCHSIVIGSDAAHLSSPDRYEGRRVYFRTIAQPGASPGFALVETLIAGAITAVDLASAAFDSVYDVPQQSDTAATEIAPVRVDLRRDVRAVCQLHKSVYKESGSIEDDPFTLPFVPRQTTPFYLEWYGAVPSGTSIDVKMYDAETGVELSDGTLTISDELGGQKTYTPNAGQRSYYLKATLTGDGTKTPLLRSVRVVRATFVENAPDILERTFPTARSGLQLPLDAVKGVNVTGPGDDASHETMSLQLQDFAGGMGFLKVRSGMPIKVQTTFDAAGVDRCVLFEGYVSQARGQKKFAGQRNYPDPWALAYDVTALGKYRRLQEQLMPKRWPWFDQVAKAGYKVTDAIKLVLKASGEPDSRIDVPDLPLRLFSENEDDLVAQPGTNLFDIVTGFAQDYLGAYVVYDPNAGTDGMWRLLQAKEYPYNTLARFETEHPGNGKTYADGAYADASATSPLGNTQTIKRTFVRRRTLEQYVEPPEGNVVVVFGGAGGDAAQGQGQAGFSVLTQTLVNTGSYNFAGLASSDPDYPDTEGPDYLGRIVPIEVFDPSLSTQEAVNWVCTRVFRAACFAHKYVSFEAPLVLVTDADDAEQRNPRPLRFYDAVEVWDPVLAQYVQYIVASCDPVYVRDRVQMARYTLVTTSNLSSFAAVQLRNGLARYRKAGAYSMKRAEGKTARTPLLSGPQALLRERAATWMEMPERAAQSIQDLEPGSGTYGEVFWQMDFDRMA